MLKHILKGWLGYGGIHTSWTSWLLELFMWRYPLVNNRANWKISIFQESNLVNQVKQL